MRARKAYASRSAVRQVAWAISARIVASARPSMCADAVEALHFQEALTGMIENTRARRRDASGGEGLQREVLGQQDVPPALAHRSGLQLAELDDDMAWPARPDRAGRELRLFPARRGAGTLTACGLGRETNGSGGAEAHDLATHCP